MAMTNVRTLEKAEAKIEAVRGTVETTMTRRVNAIHGGVKWTSWEQEWDEMLEQTGTFHPHRDQQSGIPYQRFTFELNATFEEMVWWFCVGISGGSAKRTGATTGSTPPGYTYALVPDTAADTLDTFSFVAGDTGGLIYRFDRAVVNLLTIRFNPQRGGDATWRITAEVFCRLDLDDAAFNSPAATTRTKILSKGTKIYSDAIGGTIGTTQVTGRFRSGEITIDNQVQEKVYGESTEADNDFGRGPQIVTGSVSYEFTAATEAAEFTQFRAGTRRMIQFRQTGANIGATPTTDYSAKLDLPVVNWRNPSFGEDGQNKIVTFPFVGEVSATATTPLQLTLVNALATIAA